MPFYFHDDARARAFHPFAVTRPASALRAGALLLHERWALLGETRVDGFLGAEHLADFSESGAPSYVAPRAVLPAGSLVVSSRCVPTIAQDGSAAPLRHGNVWEVEGQVMAIRLPTNLPAHEVDALFAHPPAADQRQMLGHWMTHAWDYVRTLPAQLTEDIPALAKRSDTLIDTSDVTVIGGDGPHALHVERGATIEPYVVIDLRAGPVMIRRGATVQAFTRVVGPTYVGEMSSVAGGRVAACAIGPHCRVHGEISQSVVAGYANKSHDGFVGHSYLGYWVNLGAGTITSNLKNTYGSVQMWTPDGLRDTGMTFLGALIGDYARTAIGSRLTTGTVIGAGANVVSDGIVAKVVPPFAWGAADAEPLEMFEIEKFLDVAERQMARREIPLTAAGRAHLARVHGLSVKR